MAERISNLGYMGLVKEVTKGVPLTPTDFVPLYKESLMTDINLVEDNPVYGNKFKAYQVVQGQRAHKGAFTVMAEPNTTARLFDMLLTKSSTSGAGPYTHVFGLSGTTDPNSYTVDLAVGSQVNRFFGVQASKISPSFNENEMQLEVSASALGSFLGREIASIATTVLTLDTKYDPTPTLGLVANDLVQITNAAGTTTTSFTVVSVTATTVTLNATAASFAAGDMLTLRPATPTLTLLAPFLWARSEFRFAADAATALSAAQTRLETGSDWTVAHDFESDDGAKRSGAFDPAALVRTQGDALLKIKKFFDTPEEIQRFNALTKRAVQVRHFVTSGANTYELRLTINNIKARSGVKPNLETGKILYSEIDYATSYDPTDAQGMLVTVINNLATI
jgi:hypothetical protein